MSGVIRGTGSSLPEARLTNADLERMLDTSDEWIVSRTGIHERRVLEAGEATSDLAARAGRGALDMAGLDPDEIDLVVVATTTPDMHTPSTANLVQRKLGIKRSIASFDLNAACSGFVYALEVTNALLASGRYKRALLLAAEGITRFVDYQDRQVSILFGDGAGALLLEADQGKGDILATILKADAAFCDLISIPGGAAARPASPYMLTQREQYLRMDGRQVFKLAVQALEQVVHDTLKEVGWPIEDVDHFVLHQANRRILKAVAERLEIPDEKLPSNLARTGNTASASIPILLDECQRGARFHPGDQVLCATFGAGLTWAACALRWSLELPPPV